MAERTRMRTTAREREGKGRRKRKRKRKRIYWPVELESVNQGPWHLVVKCDLLIMERIGGDSEHD